MNIWDSVHRGLDKASKEAGRIARMQRLRFQLDKVARQITTQESALLHQVMDLFLSGQLTQSELLPLCHELMSLRQQSAQAQSELQILQSQGPQPPQSGQGDPQEIHAPATSSGEIAPTTYAPPPPASSTPLYPPFDATVPAIPPPPPPPGMDLQTLRSQETVMNTQFTGGTNDALTVSGQETMSMHEGGPGQQSEHEAANALVDQGQQSRGENGQRCPQCHAEALPGYYFCQNCGSALLSQGSYYPPTMRAGGSESFYHQSGQEETIFSPSTGDAGQERPDLSSSRHENEAPSFGVPPPPPPSNTISETKDGGH
ncbi:MAG: zinc ribbon domain-containing protein [Ktedonobacteraceae bacterium]|nr:zinc ribbon domain-containing protein [Ktedonobacteraceae bacterium]